ncbi:putative eka-like protein [Erysiphe necator]|uniref:Putative eka-like protein n=1 Tax=Uncinula necator TaxID=52586 RepID=A0A0B1P1H4_UNCNE|nr:putative eka-like protein [Erysiphe necator]
MTDSMDITQDLQALSTETSQQPPPIPQSAEKILKPAIPSKRLAPEKTSQASGHNSDNANAFLPEELAEIIAIRQGRERAWHARLMICATVISNVESTLANFTEKEEVVASKAYIRLAIAKYTAADCSPAPPKISIHSKPVKGNRSSSSKEKNTLKKVAIAIQQKIVPQTVEKSWATVTRNGHKKARVTQNIVNNQVAPVRKASQSMTNKNKSSSRTSLPVSTAETRLFVPLAQDHEWRKLSPAGIREVIVKKLHISPKLIEAREEILKAGNGLFLSGAKLDAATNWISVLVPTVPAFVHMEHGKVEVSKSMLSDEIERVCSERPAHLKLYGQNNSEAPHRTWMAFFTKAPRAGFRVNCGGPHRADSRRCLARPTRVSVPTKDQMKTYRQAGEREYQAVQRARVAEEKAATTDKIEIDLVSNQIRGGIDTPENSQAAPAIDSTAVANRS